MKEEVFLKALNEVDGSVHYRVRNGYKTAMLWDYRLRYKVTRLGDMHSCSMWYKTPQGGRCELPYMRLPSYLIRNGRPPHLNVYGKWIGVRLCERTLRWSFWRGVRKIKDSDAIALAMAASRGDSVALLALKDRLEELYNE